MSEYRAPLDDMRFVLDHIVGLERLSELDAFKHADPETVYGVLEEFARFVAEVWAPTNQPGDEVGSHIEGDTVRTPPGHADAYRQFAAAGWGAVPFDEGYGGGGFPWVVGIVMQELANSANMALAMAPMLTQGAIDALAHHGSEAQRERYLAKMITGAWTGTMNLTESDAGSDVGALRTRAVVQPDGTYRITGQKIFISFGEHDFTDNIVHLVLARTPDAPPGTQGISCFIVSKFLVDDDGALGPRNDVHVVSVEHKMGIRASPTCVLAFGDAGDGAVGELIGEENTGMRTMFTMMNNARLGVGVEGLGVAERSYGEARQYASERRQGRAPGSPPGTSSPLIEHPDVRRMLLMMKASTEAMRALAYHVSGQIDLARHAPDEAQRVEAQETADLLIPLAKSWCTDTAERVTSIGIQVFGGMGYIEETGVAQHYRDAKVTQIYEGTNGIQAMDLVGRKLPMRAGAVYRDQLHRMRATLDELEVAGAPVEGVHHEFAAALDALDAATTWLFENGTDPLEALSAATPYQRLFATVVAGWLMGRSALAARSLLDAGAGNRSFLEAKIVTARFYANHILPEVHALLPAVRSGKLEIMALTPEQF